MSPTSPLAVEVVAERWALRETFAISRGAKTHADVITVTVSDGVHRGRGEAVPYARYGESIAAACAALNALPAIRAREDVQCALPPGAARNALDCALWDLEAKRRGISAATLAGLPPLAPVLTCYTISLDTPQEMAVKAARVPHLPLLKLKLAGAGDDARMRAVREARPNARLVVDANEAWTPELAPQLFAAAAEARIELIEQPFPADADDVLRAWPQRPVPVCADESLHTRTDLARLATLYDAINIKLDKAGGLTEALALKREAEQQNLRVMVGSMVATSLAAAPALLVAQGAEWTDLDGPLLLAEDRPSAINILHGVMSPPAPELWG